MVRLEFRGSGRCGRRGQLLRFGRRCRSRRDPCRVRGARRRERRERGGRVSCKAPAEGGDGGIRAVAGFAIDEEGWSEGRHDPFGGIEDLDKEAAEEDQGGRLLIDPDGEEANRVVGDIAPAIAIKVVALVLAPVVLGEAVGVVVGGIGGNVEGIGEEVVFLEGGVGGVGEEFEGVAVFVEEVSLDGEAVRAFGEKPGGIGKEAVVGDLAIGDIFQEQAVGRRTPVSQEGIAVHPDVAGEHHSYACAVVFKGIGGVLIVVREHKVQAVAEVFGGKVVGDEAVFGKLQVDPVAVGRDAIGEDADRAAFPEVDAVACVGFLADTALEEIALEGAAFGIFEVDAEEGTEEGVVLEVAGFAIFDPDGGPVVKEGRGDVLEGDPGDADVIGFDDEDIALGVAGRVKDHAGLTAQDDRFGDPEVGDIVEAGLEEKSVERTGLTEAFGEAVGGSRRRGGGRGGEGGP